MMEQLLKILEFDNIKALLLVDSYLSQENVELIINVYILSLLLLSFSFRKGKN